MDAHLIQGPVGQSLLKLSIPMAWGVFAIIAFNLADTYFVSKLGTTELAAISFTFPVVMILGNLAIGIGVGAVSVISRAISNEDISKVQRLTTDALALAVIIVGIFLLFGMLTIDPLFRMLGADEDTLPYIHQYMEIWYLGMFFLVVPMVGNNAIRASGDTVYPSMIMTVSAAINTALDPVLIFGLYGFPQLGLRGAAIATVFARAISLAASLAVLKFRKNMVSLAIPSFAEVWDSWKRILKIGIPAAAMFIIMPISAGIITKIISLFGKESVAAYGVANKIESFSLIAIFGLSTSITPFIGQNAGARCFDRIRKAINISYFFCIVWGIFIAIVLGFKRYYFASLFSDNDRVIEIVALYLMIVPVSHGMLGVCLIISSSFNGLAKPLPATWLTFLRTILLLIPVAWIVSKMMGQAGIFICISVCNFIAAIWGMIWLYRTLRRINVQPG